MTSLSHSVRNDFTPLFSGISAATFSNLLTSQSSNRVGNRCLDRLETYRQHGYQQGSKPGDGECPPTDIDPVREVFQPFIHCPPRYRRCDDDGYHHEFEKIC